MSAYEYRVKKGLVWLVTEEDFDLPKPTSIDVSNAIRDAGRILPLVRWRIALLWTILSISIRSGGATFPVFVRLAGAPSHLDRKWGS